GFSYEPRGLSQSTAVGILLMTIYFTKIPKKILLIFIPFCLYFGFAKTMSAAGIATMVMGLTLILFSSLFLNGRKYFHSLQIKIVAITILILPLVFLTLTGDSKSQFKKHMQNRSYLLKGTSLIDRLEDQESSALNFLLSSPKAFFLGAGPGMVYLPASKYRVKKFEVENPLGAKNLFNVLPHMGMILQLSNGGLLSFSLLTVLFLFLLQKMVIRKDIIPTHHIVLFILFSGLYLFQVRLIYYTAIAIGMSYNLGKKKG
ncbi:MAG: hypothetical protein KC478_10510, partial [Bacteriovoracaceae bacterium]|nr:hypothetical protein [Bacteriovoracaceae bacterium]